MTRHERATAAPVDDVVPGVSIVGTTRALGTDVEALLTRFGTADDDGTEPERPRIEVVLVDDGATPGAFNELQEAGERTGRVRSVQLMALPDRRDHLYEAGLRIARGDFVLLLDAPAELDLAAVQLAYEAAIQESWDVVLLAEAADGQAADADPAAPGRLRDRPVDAAALRGRALIRRSLLADPPAVVAPLPADVDLRQLGLVAVGRTGAVGVLPLLPRQVATDPGLTDVIGWGPLEWRPLATAARAVVGRHTAARTAVEDVVFLATVLGLDERAYELIAVQLDAYAPRPLPPPPPPVEEPADRRARFADRLAVVVEGADHRWRDGRLFVALRAQVLLDGVPFHQDDDAVPGDVAAELEATVRQARPVVTAVRRGTALQVPSDGTATSEWADEGWRLTAEAEIDPQPPGEPLPAETVLDLFVEVEVFDRTLSAAVTHRGQPHLPALINGTPVIAYRTRAGLLALDVGSTLHDVVALVLRHQVRLTASDGGTALAVPDLHAVGLTHLPGTIAFGDRRLPVHLVHDGAGTRVQLEADSRVSLDWPDRNAAADLDAIGRSHGLDQASDFHDYLRDYQVELDARPVRSMVIISGKDPDAMAKAFASFLPDATIHVLSVTPDAQVEVGDRIRHRYCPEVADVVSYLQEVPPPDAIIEDGTNVSSHKAACFRLGFLHLADRGIYIAEDLHAHWMTRYRDHEVGVAQYVDTLLTLKSSPRSVLAAASRYDRERSEALHRVSHYGKFLVAERRGDHLVKVRDDDVDRVLTGRRGSGWGEVLFGREPTTVQARSALEVSASATAPDRFARRIDIPALRSRRYRDAICAPRQLVLLGDVLPSIAFHHPLDVRFHTAAARDVGPDIAALPEPLPTPEVLPGIYYHLDSEYPGHFGHFMTEDIGRLWGWPEAKQRHPELKLLIGSAAPGEPLPGFQRTVLNAYGISDDDIVSFDGPVSVEQLIGVSPMFHNARYVHPELPTVWASLRLRLVPDRATPHRRLFVARADGLDRRCHNAAEVEQIFGDHGFEIVYPERSDFTDQVRMFAEASVIAGWAGSGLLGSIFAPRDATRIVLASEAYDATNEWLIASVQGGSYHHFWCTPDVRQPDGGWSRRAFHSDFTFDLDTHGAALRRLLERG